MLHSPSSRSVALSAVLLLVLAASGPASPQAAGPPVPSLGEGADDGVLPDQLNEVDPEVQLDGAGHVYRLWTDEWRGLGRHIRFQRSSDGGETWLPAALILDQGKPSGARSTAPSLAVEAGGRLYAVWRMKLASGGKEVRFATSADRGATWTSAAQPLNLGGSAFSARVATAGAGHVYAVWYDERSRGGAQGRGAERGLMIFFNRSTDFGRTWLGEDVRLSGEKRVLEQVPDGYKGTPREIPVPFISAQPRLVADAQGGVFVAWLDNRDGTMQVYFRGSTDHGRSWGPEINVSRGGSSAKGHQIVTDGAGRLLVVWADSRDGFPDVFLARSEDAGRSWSPVERLSRRPAGVTASLAPHMAVGPDGRVYVAWQDLRHGREDIYLNVSPDLGRTWLERDIRLDRDDAGTGVSRGVRVVTGGPGEVAVLWEDDRAGFEQILLTRSTDGGRTWLPREIRVDDTAGPRERSRHVQAAWGRDGVLHVVWERWAGQGRDAQKRVAYRRIPLRP